MYSFHLVIFFPGFFPCEVPFLDSVTYLLEPEDNVKFTRLSLGYVEKEERILPSEARFGGHQTLKDREKSYHATNQTIHCGFVSGPDGFPSSGFDLDEKDKKYMNACRIVVSSCIFGSFDFLRRPTSKLVTCYAFWKYIIVPFSTLFILLCDIITLLLLHNTFLSSCRSTSFRVEEKSCKMTEILQYIGSLFKKNNYLLGEKGKNSTNL